MRPKMILGCLTALAGALCLKAENTGNSDLLSIALIASGTLLALFGAALIFSDTEDQAEEQQRDKLLRRAKDNNPIHNR